MAELALRRRVLIERCDAQRVELAARFGQLSHGPLGWARLAGGAAGGRRGGHPLAWILTLAGLVLLRRPPPALKMIAWTRSVLAVLSRVGEVMTLLAALRRPRPR
jgi:hypothetical protein